MSSFYENFQREEEANKVRFDTNAFYPVLLTAIVVGIIVEIIINIRNLFSKFLYTKDIYKNCQCSFCKEKLKKYTNNFEKEKKKKNHFLILLILVVISIPIYYKILLTQGNVKTFDPYEILEISKNAELKDIKKSYKKLALKYHPDKNLGNPQAKAMFILVTKAYDALTDEESKKNFELYGNPDGRSRMKLSVGLPSFVLDKKNHFKILLIFLIVVVFIIPYNFYKWYLRTKMYNDFGILASTSKKLFFSTSDNTIIKHIPFYLGMSDEFIVNGDVITEDQKNIINIEFNRHKDMYPVIEGLDYNSINIKYKKAIGIGYAYLKKKLKNLPQSITNKEEYIKLLGKLADEFYLRCVEKVQKLTVFEIQRSKGLPIKLPEKLKPIKSTFLIEVLKYQQCFFSGIPIDYMNSKYAPFYQIPWLNVPEMQKINEKLSFIEFINQGSKEDKLEALLKEKNITLKEEQIKDINEVCKSFPMYEYKITPNVEGFDDFIVGDVCTYTVNIKRSNIGNSKNIGICHSKDYPGLVNECVQLSIFSRNIIIKQDKIKITGKKTTHEFKLLLQEEGTIRLMFDFRPTCFYGLDGHEFVDIHVQKKTEKRTQMLENINKRRVKLQPSFFQQLLKENGLILNLDDDEEESSDEEETKKENNNNSQSTEQNNNSQKNENINNKYDMNKEKID